jgi:transposase InsO family protein
MRHERITVARCTVERLMKQLGLQGARRGKVVRTTIGDMTAARPMDRVNRQFKADRPNQLLVSDFTYVSTWPGRQPRNHWNLLHLTGYLGLTTTDCWSLSDTFPLPKLKKITNDK